MLDRNEIAALLGSLCERPFGRDQEGQRGAIEASRLAQALTDAEAERRPDQAQSGQATRSGEVTAALASILSATATSAQCHGFQETAAISGAARLEAQSALAFLDEHRACTAGSACRSGGGGAGVCRRRTAAPAAGGLVPPLVPPFGQPARQAARAGGGCLRHPACRRLILVAARTSGPGHRPRHRAGGDGPQRTGANRQIGSGVCAGTAFDPGGSPGTRTDRSGCTAPSPPVAQALADPCAPGSSATSQGGARSKFETNAAKPAPIPQLKTASVLGPDPDCAVSVGASEGGRRPRADRGPVRAARPAAKIGTLDHDPAAAAAPAPYAGDARPASSAMRPSAVQPPR